MRLLVGTQQTRLVRTPLLIMAQGKSAGDAPGYEDQLGDTWTIPGAYAVVLRPYCLRPQWLDTFSGDYARLTFSDFGLSEGNGGWLSGKSPVRMVRSSGMAAPVVSVAAHGENRGWYVSWYQFSAGTGQTDPGTGYFEFGLSDAGNGSSGLAFRVSPSGECEIWRDGKLAASGALGARHDGFHELVVVPTTRRSLAVHSLTGGQTVVHRFEQEPAVPNERFWFYLTSGAADVEVAPLKFPTTGTGYSLVYGFQEPPISSDVPVYGTAVETFGDSALSVSTSLVKPDLSAFAANGSDVLARIRLDMSGTTQRSPVVFWAFRGYGPITAQTDDSEEYDVWPHCLTDVALSVPEHPANASLSARVMDPLSLPISATYGAANVPAVLDDGASPSPVVYMAGATEPLILESRATDEASEIEYRVRDIWGRLESAMFRDPYPFDGLTLTQAIERVIQHAGFSASEMDVEADLFVLPFPASPATEFATHAEPGQTCAEWVERLVHTFAGHWLFGFFPTPSGYRFRAGSPDTHFGTTPVYSLYSSAEDAAQALNVPHSQALGHVYRSLRYTWIPPEANEVRVTGWDPLANLPIQAWYRDDASADPSLPPSQRPDNWIGEIRTVYYADPMIQTQAQAERACQTMARRLTQRRVLYEFEAPLLVRANGVPVWRGDVVDIAGVGPCRISSLEARWVADHDWTFNTTRYTAVAGAGTYLPTSYASAMLEQIRFSAQEAAAQVRRIASRFGLVSVPAPRSVSRVTSL